MSVAGWWSQTIGRLRNRSLLDAAMATAALVATADEDVRLAEQLALDRVLEDFEEFRFFEPHTAVDRHRHFAGQILANRERGRRQAMRVLAAFRGADAQRRILLRVGKTIAAADSVISESERRVLSEISETLGIPLEAVAQPRPSPSLD